MSDAASTRAVDSRVTFTDKAFCFTGKLAELKRSAAEREVRARGGLLTDRISERLDFLVVGDEPSPAWKYGRYGRKIEEARALIAGGSRRPVLVSEAAFMETLAFYPPVNAGAIDGKIVVCNYKFLIHDDHAAFDQDALERAVSAVAQRFRCHVTCRGSWATVRSQLFGEPTAGVPGALVVEYRFVRQQSLDEPVTDYLDAVTRAFEGLPGVDGNLRWFERVEGSADYIRLLEEVPSSLRVAGI